MSNQYAATRLRYAETQGSSRNSNLELLRILSAFGIIAYHSKAPFFEVPYAGLILFLALSPFVDAWFNWGKVRPLSHSFRTLLLPWAFWMAAYALANVLVNKPPLPKGLSVSALLYGSSGHLWFLPFIFAVTLLLRPLKRIGNPNLVFWPSCVVAAGLLVLTPLWRPYAIDLPAPYAQWTHAAASIFAGLALGLYRLSGRFAWAGIAIVGGAILICLTYRIPGMGVTYLLGIGALALGAFLPELMVARAEAIRAVSQCMFGVYLVHMFVMAVVGRLMHVNGYAAALLVFVVSIAGVWAARRFAPQSKLVLG